MSHQYTSHALLFLIFNFYIVFTLNPIICSVTSYDNILYIYIYIYIHFEQTTLSHSLIIVKMQIVFLKGKLFYLRLGPS